MTVAVAGRLRVLDASAPLDYSVLSFRKSQSRSSCHLGEYGIHRIPFHFPLADRKLSPQSTRNRSLDKTERIRITMVFPPHLECVPPHLDIFCNIASDHLVSDYAGHRLLFLYVDPFNSSVFVSELPETCQNLPELEVTFTVRCCLTHCWLEGDVLRCANGERVDYSVSFTLENINN